MEEQFFEHFRDALDAQGKAININDRFRDYDEWSSLAGLSLIAMLDDVYGIVIPPDELRKLNTVGELLGEVKKRKQ